MNSNNSPSGLFDRGEITRAGVPNWTIPAFAIPIVQPTHESNANYLQQVDARGIVVGFRMYTGSTRTIHVAEPRLAQVGQPEIYALIDPYGTALAGTRGQLRSSILQWVDSVGDPIQRMNFARFCGADKLASRAARQAIASKTKEFGDEHRGVRWFIDSVLLMELITTLGVSNGLDSDDIDSMLNEYSPGVHIDASSPISVYLPTSLLRRIEPQRRRVRSELTRLLSFAAEATGRSFNILEDSVQGDPVDTPSFRVIKLLEEIDMLGRQEERIALVMQTMLSDSKAAEYVLEHYRGRAQFEISTLERLRISFEPKESMRQTEIRLARLVAKIVSYAYPMQKGRLLLDLATRLRSFDMIAESIKHEVMRLRAQNVAQVRSEVLSVLNS